MVVVGERVVLVVVLGEKVVSMVVVAVVRGG